MYAISCSLAEAAFRSVSSVMYVFLIHSAVEAFTITGLSSWLSFLTNALASSGVALGGVWAERGSADKNNALSDAGRNVWSFMGPAR